MARNTFDFSGLLRTDLPAAATPWTGFPVHNFVGGHNDQASIPVDLLSAAVTRALQRDGKFLANYSLHTGPLGYRPLREFLVRKLHASAGIECDADQVLIVSGSLQALDLINRILVAPGDTVITEQMTYGAALTRLARCGANVVGVPVDADGLDTAALARTLERLAREGVRPKYIYTIPTVQNPTGTMMSMARRRELLALAVQYELPIVEDECYCDLTWTGQRLPALYALAQDDRVIHIGSFSKTIASGLRLGYLVADWPIQRRLLSVKGDGGCGGLEQLALAEFCTSHFDQHLPMVRKNLHAKLQILIDALRREFGAAARFAEPLGGIFLWVELPDTVDTSRLTELAAQQGIAINPGIEWCTDAELGRRHIRICYAHPSEPEIRAGIAALARLCREQFKLFDRPSAIEQRAA